MLFFIILHYFTPCQTMLIHIKFLSDLIGNFEFFYSTLNVLFFIRNHHHPIPHFPHGTFHFFVPESVNQRIEQGS